MFKFVKKFEIKQKNQELYIWKKLFIKFIINKTISSNYK